MVHVDGLENGFVTRLGQLDIQEVLHRSQITIPESLEALIEFSGLRLRVRLSSRVVMSRPTGIYGRQTMASGSQRGPDRPHHSRLCATRAGQTSLRDWVASIPLRRDEPVRPTPQGDDG